MPALLRFCMGAIALPLQADLVRRGKARATHPAVTSPRAKQGPTEKTTPSTTNAGAIATPVLLADLPCCSCSSMAWWVASSSTKAKQSKQDGVSDGIDVASAAVYTWRETGRVVASLESLTRSSMAGLPHSAIASPARRQERGRKTPSDVGGQLAARYPHPRSQPRPQPRALDPPAPDPDAAHSLPLPQDRQTAEQRLMGLIAWLSLFKFSWLRRCKTCGVRGSKCLCRRPSLALEHIFFLEERKNKFGARNFSHVSDTMMTSNSTMMTSSTMFASSTNGTGAGPPSNLSGSTVLMRGPDGSFADSDVNPTDYYYQTAAATDANGEMLTPRMDRKADRQLRRNQQQQGKKQRSVSRRGENNSKLQAEAAAPTALVRKQSGRMMSRARRKGDKNTQPPIKEIVTGEYILYSEENIPVSLPHRQQQQIVPHDRRRSRSQSKSVKVSARSQYKEEPGVTFQFYGRSGSGRGGAPAVPVPAPTHSNRSISMSSSCSSNDSFVMSSGSISSMRVSQYSDRVSLETNFGSLNPQSNLANTGRFIESGYAPSIQEDDEAQALSELNGWLHASSVSTQDSFMLSR